MVSFHSRQSFSVSFFQVFLGLPAPRLPSICISYAVLPGRVAQSVTCLATDACLTADPGVVSSIPAWYHTFVKIDHEIISTVILLPSADSFKKGCCQLQAKYEHKPLAQACPGKSVVK